MKHGYDPFFLSEKHYIPLPLPQGRTAADVLDNGETFDFTHFSIVMNRRTREAWLRSTRTFRVLEKRSASRRTGAADLPVVSHPARSAAL